MVEVHYLIALFSCKSRGIVVNYRSINETSEASRVTSRQDGKIYPSMFQNYFPFYIHLGQNVRKHEENMSSII